MGDDIYPDLEKICRLCLCIFDNTDSLIDIFPQSESLSATGISSVKLSISMRIMACASLEVQKGDGLPKAICKECRYQLENSYYFRKRSQQSDSKLRKHMRLLNLGKKSRVFSTTDDDDFENEIEFEDSLQFIEKSNELRKAEEYAQWKDKFQVEMKEKMANAKEEWMKEFKSLLRVELKEELRQEIVQEMRVALREECTELAKIELRQEIVDECRDQERQMLLDDLQQFLKNKRIDKTASNANVAAPVKAPSMRKVQQQVSIEQIGRIIKRDVSASPPIVSYVDNDTMCHEIEADGEGRQEFYVVETVNRNEDEDTETIGKRAAKRQKTGNSQRFEYFEDRMGSANFRLTASESSSHEPGAESYHIADPGEIQYYKKDRINEDAGQEIDNDGDVNEDEDVIVFNFEEGLDGEHSDPMNLPDMSKKIIVVKPSKPEQSADEDQKLGDEPLFTKRIVADNADPIDLGNSTDVPIHLRKTDTPKTFKCDSCPTVFSTSNALNRHQRTHRKMEQLGVSFQCSVCFIFLSCKSALNRHMVIHTGERPHVCAECGKSFVQREILKRHMLTHTGIKPHKCPHCRISYTQKNNLVQHINRAHTEVPVVQQYSCHLCPKRFSHTSGLSRHLVTHTGLTFQCTECKRKFADRSSVKRHILNVHGRGKRTATQRGTKSPSAVEFYSIDESEMEKQEENATEFLV